MKPLGRNQHHQERDGRDDERRQARPCGRSASVIAIRKIDPTAAPMMVRRPPITAAMITCTPTVIETSVETEAVPM